MILSMPRAVIIHKINLHWQTITQSAIPRDEIGSQVTQMREFVMTRNIIFRSIHNQTPEATQNIVLRK